MKLSLVALAAHSKQVSVVVFRISLNCALPAYFGWSALVVLPGTQKSIAKMSNGIPQGNDSAKLQPNSGS